MNKTYYDILGVNPETSEREIKQAYRKLARNLHPDKTRNREERQKKEKIFAVISEAYNILKDHDKRREYDQRIKIEKSGKDSISNAPSVERQSKSESKSISKERSMIAKKACLKGLQALKNRDYNGAITLFQAAIENDNSDPVYYYRLAMSLMLTKKSFTKAVEYCNEAINKDPYNYDYKLLLGEIYEKAGGITKAAKIYEDILKWDKTHFKARENLRRLGYSPDGKNNKSFIGNLIRKIRGK